METTGEHTYISKGRRSEKFGRLGSIFDVGDGNNRVEDAKVDDRIDGYGDAVLG